MKVVQFEPKVEKTSKKMKDAMPAPKILLVPLDYLKQVNIIY